MSESDKKDDIADAMRKNAVNYERHRLGEVINRPLVPPAGGFEKTPVAKTPETKEEEKLEVAAPRVITAVVDEKLKLGDKL